MTKNLIIVLLIWILVTFLLIAGCTTSHVYVSTGTAAKAGQRAHIQSEVDAVITGIHRGDQHNLRPTYE